MPEQIALFEELPPGCRVRKSRARPCVKGFDVPDPVQMEFDLLARNEDGDEDPFVTAPIIHRTIKAKDAKPLEVKAPRSVFDMAIGQMTHIKFQPQGKAAITRVERLDGIVRCIRIIEQDTEAWKAKEAARRARQIVPKPPKSARMISKKFQDLVK